MYTGCSSAGSGAGVGVGSGVGSPGSGVGVGVGSGAGAAQPPSSLLTSFHFLIFSFNIPYRMASPAYSDPFGAKQPVAGVLRSVFGTGADVLSHPGSSGSYSDAEYRTQHGVEQLSLM